MEFVSCLSWQSVWTEWFIVTVGRVLSVYDD